jgi:hypothetical protein
VQAGRGRGENVLVAVAGEVLRAGLERGLEGGLLGRARGVQATEFAAPRFPPLRVKACRTSATVRLGLSVVASMKMAAPPGP